MTNDEALTLRPGDRIRLHPRRGGGLTASYVVARVTITDEGPVIVTTTGLHLAPSAVERVPRLPS